MTRQHCFVEGLFVMVLLLGGAAQGQERIERYLLVAGANDGGPGRPALRYAVSDAEAFAKVLQEMGGVDEERRIVLQEPGTRELRRGFAQMDALLRRPAVAGNARREVLIYYSGHAAEGGLLLGKETFPWKDLRREVDALSADVKITVVDACGSGAITRLKGGERRPAFLLDASTDMKGYAFLTSSSDNEASQESDRIRGSFFTHSLVTGLRGAADLSNDGKVTLGEAYQFAFQETLARTQKTTGGAQHPSRDMNLSGTGDVVITDLRSTAAGVILSEDLDGRFFIRDNQGHLVAELRKMAGRDLELGLAPGRYEIQMEQKAIWSTPEIDLSEGTRRRLTAGDFRAERRERTAMRGGISSVMDSLRAQPQALSFGFFLDRQRDPWRGTQLSFLFTDAHAERVGFQVSGVANLARAPMEGLQVSGVANIASGRVDGQVSGSINFADNVSGVQLSGGFNIADTVQGLQSAPFSIALGTVEGAQIGMNNLAVGTVRGVQVGIASVAWDTITNIQAGIINIAYHAKKSQYGLINGARKVEGSQWGLINYSDSIGGVPIGLLSYSGSGLFGVRTTADETGKLHHALQSGVPAFYTQLLFSHSPQDPHEWGAFGLGFGTRFGMSGPAFLFAETEHLSVYSNGPSRQMNAWDRLRLGASQRILPGVSLVGGITGNWLHQGSATALMVRPMGEWHGSAPDGGIWWTGVYAGISLQR